jgi:hypothetical protein
MQLIYVALALILAIPFTCVVTQSVRHFLNIPHCRTEKPDQLRLLRSMADDFLSTSSSSLTSTYSSIDSDSENDAFLIDIARNLTSRCIRDDEFGELDSSDLAAFLQLALYEQLTTTRIDPRSCGCHSLPIAGNAPPWQRRNQPRPPTEFAHRKALESVLERTRFMEQSATQSNEHEVAVLFALLLTVLVAGVAFVGSVLCLVAMLLCCPVRLAAKRLARQLSHRLFDADDALPSSFYTQLLGVTKEVNRVVYFFDDLQWATWLLRWNHDVFKDLATQLRSHTEFHPWALEPPRFAIMASFCGEQRPFVANVCSLLKNVFNLRVFYDRDDLPINGPTNCGIAYGLLHSQSAVAFVSSKTFAKAHPLAELIVLMARNHDGMSLFLAAPVFEPAPAITLQRSDVVNFLRLFCESGSPPLIPVDVPVADAAALAPLILQKLHEAEPSTNWLSHYRSH